MEQNHQPSTDGGNPADAEVSGSDAAPPEPAQVGWTRALGGPDRDQARDVAIAPDGSVIVVGFFSDVASFGGATQARSNGRHDAFVLRMSQNGELMWLRAFGGIDDDHCNRVAVAPDGSIYVVGWFTETVDFDPGPGERRHTASGGEDVFVLRLDMEGTLAWARVFGGAQEDTALGLALGQDRVHITGAFAGPSDFDPGPAVANHTSSGNVDAFVVTLDMQGQYLWSRVYGGSGEDFGVDLAVSPDGSAYLTGAAEGVVDFEPATARGVLTLSPSGDPFVLGLDAQGNHIWVGHMPSRSAHGLRIVAAPDGSLLVGGSFHEHIDLDPSASADSRQNDGNDDGFLVALHPSGTYKWGHTFAGPDHDSVLGLAVAPTGAVYASGSFMGTADLDPGSSEAEHRSKGDSDAFLVAMDLLGRYQWSWVAGSRGADGALGVAATEDAVFVVGGFEGEADFDPGPAADRRTSQDLDAFVTRLSSEGTY